MQHRVWFASDPDGSRDECLRIVGRHGVAATTVAPRQSPDLIVTPWETRDSASLLPPEWSEAAPSAHVYLVRPEDVDAVLEHHFTDPLHDALLLPTRAEDVALAVLRALIRRDQYLNLGAGLARVTTSHADVDIIGTSGGLRNAIVLAERVALSPGTSVLIQGESGTGKELLARLIHRLTPGRRHRPFVDLNCAAIPSELLEAELFGFERGAFTNAGREKAGLMELAHGGTLFLDEIGELNVGLQAKLLRVLEAGTFRRLGGVAERRSNCRVVASTNRNLLEAVQHGYFRLDLYHRLAVLTVPTPPLRDRREDIMPLAQHFLRRFSLGVRKSMTGFSPTAQALLMGYPYPGNVRELSNIVERAVIIASGPIVTPKDLGLELALMADSNLSPIASPSPSPPGGLLHPSQASRVFPGAEPSTGDWRQSLADKERQHIEQVLVNTHGNRAMAARLLGISIPTIYKKIRKYNLEHAGR